jgi:transcriptional regulator with GAF, ATPase, and Fis domain
MKTTSGLSSIITNSDKYLRVLTQVRRVAETQATVLITGETGTGKELLAKAVHELSERSNEPLIKVNAAVIPENLFESELFGHEKGAFTGAVQSREGRFEAADGGTIFLDEIGEMPVDLQAKLLRVLQEGEFERVGGSKTIKVNVRVVAATNRNLEEMVGEGKFREDLYYRLNVFPVHNLPLRERKEDIPLLIDFFLKKYARKVGKNVKEVPKASLNELMKYEFPGNVRELENMVERALILSSTEYLNLDTILKSGIMKKKKRSGKFQTLDEMQRTYIIKAIKRCNGRISGKDGAAIILGLNDKTLYSRIKKLGIKKTEYLA